LEQYYFFVFFLFFGIIVGYREFLVQNGHYVVIFCARKNCPKKCVASKFDICYKTDGNGEYGPEILLEALETYSHLSNHRF